MSSLSHNKKRNVGLLREFFSKHIASCIVNKDKQSAINAQSIWNKYVQTGTEIQKEMKIASVLMEAKFDNKQVAHDFLIKVKKAAKQICEKKLEREKTTLLREINNKITDQSFFARSVPDYVELASIQLLINNWIKEDSQPVSIDSQYFILEDRVLNYLCTNQKIISENNDLKKNVLLETNSDNVDSLVVSIMNEKFNEKFANQLTENQKFILKQFVFEDCHEELKNKMLLLKEETLSLLNKELSKTKSMVPSELKKLEEIKSLLENDYSDINLIDENNIIFYMSISKLNEELKETK
jgi:hypothetical protein